jgi:hypothetical protein
MTKELGKNITSHLDTDNLFVIIDRICGQSIFKGKYPESTAHGYKLVVSRLNRSNSKQFTTINDGKIFTEMSYDICVKKLVDEIKNEKLFFAFRGQTDVTDMWAKNQSKRSWDKSVEPMDCPRYNGVEQTEDEFIKSYLENCNGLLSEGYVLKHFNEHYDCPECGVNGKVGWYNNGQTSTSFRDGICLNCRENNITTLFEIKTRWEASIKDKSSTFAGDYVALHSLLNNGANVYLIVASRDTGTIRLGKITFAFMKATSRFLYGVQEKLNWGSPGSTIKCGDGLNIMDVQMDPPLEILLSDDICKKISDEVYSLVKV